jgi:hypothetical protein
MLSRSECELCPDSRVKHQVGRMSRLMCELCRETRDPHLHILNDKARVDPGCHVVRLAGAGAEAFAMYTSTGVRSEVRVL